MSSFESRNPSTVAAVVPCFNAGEGLRTTLRSLLEQSRPPDEIIVVDDGSSDTSASIAGEYWPTVRVISIDNSGAAIARFTGVFHSISELIVFVDAGDFAPVQKIASLAGALDRHPECVCSYGVAWNRVLPRPETSPLTGGILNEGLTVLHEPFLRILGQSWPVTTVMNVAVRRHIAIQSCDVSGFYRAANDYAAQLRTALHGPFVHVASITAEFETTPNGITRRFGLNRQLAYALLAADETFRQLRNVDGAVMDVFRRRVENDWPPVALNLYLQGETELFDRILAVGRRYGVSFRAFRRFWWAVDRAYGEGKLKSRPMLRSAALLGRSLRAKN